MLELWLGAVIELVEAWTFGDWFMILGSFFGACLLVTFVIVILKMYVL